MGLQFMLHVLDEALKEITTMRFMKELKFIIGLILLVAFSVAVSFAQESPAPEPAAANSDGASTAGKGISGQPQLQSRESRYEIHPGDSFDINFELSPEFNQTGVTVQP